MALTIEVKKVSVKEVMPKLWSIALNLRCLDGETEVINQNFGIRYRTGQEIDVVVKKIVSEMQKAIDKYKAEQIIFSHQKLDSAITDISSLLKG